MKHLYNIDIFKKQTDAFYYLLGVFLTDGNISIGKHHNKLQLTSKDKDWLISLANILRCPVYPTKDGHGNLTINSKEICRILISHGCAPHKSLSLTMPTVPLVYLRDFIRGCWDGDGSIPKTGRAQCYLCSSSRVWLEDIQVQINNNGFKSAIYEIKKLPCKLKNGKTIIPKNKHYRLMLTGEEAVRFVRWIYYPQHSLSMPRKSNIAKMFGANGGT